MLPDTILKMPTPDIRLATPEDAARIAAVHVASWRESYTGLLPESVLTELSVSDRTKRWARILADATHQGGSAVVVAELAGGVVGFASGGAQRDPALRNQGFTGEISALYVLRRAQNIGTGRRLIETLAQSLRTQGHQAACLWVLRDNQPARGFYERLGGEIVAEKEDRRGDVSLVDIAYGWRDIAVLTKRRRSA